MISVEASIAERRSKERLKIYLDVFWEGIAGRYAGTISDISLGGCFILSDGKVNLNELLRLEIKLPTDETVMAWGEVANHFPEIGFGVRYTEFEARERERYLASIEYVKNFEDAVEALKRLDAAVIKREFEAPGCILISPQQYKALVMLAFPKVNKALLSVPECRRKEDIRLSMESYLDASRLWELMTPDQATDPKAMAEMYNRLKTKYKAHEALLKSLLQKDAPPVLEFLWQKASIYLASTR